MTAGAHPDDGPARPVILLAFANDRHGDRAAYLRDLVRERRALERALGPLGDAARVVVRTQTRLDDLFDDLAVFNDEIVVFHYGGHALPEGLAFEDDDGRPAIARVQALGERLGQLSALRLVFLNGCGTAAHVGSVRRHCGAAVIATDVAVLDRVACAFAARFYADLAAGRSIEAAYRSATSQMRAGAEGPSAVRRGDAELRMLGPADHPQGADDWPWGLHPSPAAPDGTGWRLPAASGGGSGGGRAGWIAVAALGVVGVLVAVALGPRPKPAVDAGPPEPSGGGTIERPVVEQVFADGVAMAGDDAVATSGAGEGDAKAEVEPAAEIEAEDDKAKDDDDAEDDGGALRDNEAALADNEVAPEGDPPMAGNADVSRGIGRSEAAGALGGSATPEPGSGAGLGRGKGGALADDDPPRPVPRKTVKKRDALAQSPKAPAPKAEHAAGAVASVGVSSKASRRPERAEASRDRVKPSPSRAPLHVVEETPAPPEAPAAPQPMPALGDAPGDGGSQANNSMDDLFVPPDDGTAVEGRARHHRGAVWNLYGAERPSVVCLYPLQGEPPDGVPVRCHVDEPVVGVTCSIDLRRGTPPSFKEARWRRCD